MSAAAGGPPYVGPFGVTPGRGTTRAPKRRHAAPRTRKKLPAAPCRCLRSPASRFPKARHRSPSNVVGTAPPYKVARDAAVVPKLSGPTLVRECDVDRVPMDIHPNNGATLLHDLPPCGSAAEPIGFAPRNPRPCERQVNFLVRPHRENTCSSLPGRRSTPLSSHGSEVRSCSLRIIPRDSV